MQKTFMRKQLKLKGGGGGSELKLTLADVYGKKKKKRVCKVYCALHSIDKRCTNEIKWQQPVTDMIRNFVSQNIINL